MIKALLAHALFLISLSLSAIACAEDLFVRPSGSSYGLGDGSSYENAFSGFSTVMWGEAQGQVGPGDTLYVCGDHLSMLTVRWAGTAQQPIVIDGNCHAGSINVGNNATMAIEQRSVPEGRSYIIVQNLRLTGGTSATIHCNGSAGGPCRGNVYANNTITATKRGDGVGGISIRNPSYVTIKGNTLYGANLGAKGITLDDPIGQKFPSNSFNVIEHNRVHGWYWYGIRFLGLSDTQQIEYPGRISYNDVYNNGDGIYHFRTKGVITEYNTVHHNNDTSTILGEGYGMASTRSANGIWRGNIVFSNRTKGLEPWYDDLTPPSDYTYILNNVFYDNGTGNEPFHCAIHVSNSGQNFNFPNTFILGNLVRGSKCGISVYRGVSGVIANNTVVNPEKETGIFLGTGSSNLLVVNNVLSTGGVAGIWASNNGVGNIVISHNLFSNGMFGIAVRIANTNYSIDALPSLSGVSYVRDVLFVNPAGFDYRLRGPRGVRPTGYPYTDPRCIACYVAYPDLGAYPHIPQVGLDIP